MLELIFQCSFGDFSEGQHANVLWYRGVGESLNQVVDGISHDVNDRYMLAVDGDLLSISLLACIDLI